MPLPLSQKKLGLFAVQEGLTKGLGAKTLEESSPAGGDNYFINAAIVRTSS